MGTTVTLTAAQAPAGKMFDKWIVTGATVADETSATTTFIMPAGEVTQLQPIKIFLHLPNIRFLTSRQKAPAQW